MVTTVTVHRSRLHAHCTAEIHVQDSKVRPNNFLISYRVTGNPSSHYRRPQETRGTRLGGLHLSDPRAESVASSREISFARHTYNSTTWNSIQDHGRRAISICCATRVIPFRSDSEPQTCTIPKDSGTLVAILSAGLDLWMYNADICATQTRISYFPTPASILATYLSTFPRSSYPSQSPNTFFPRTTLEKH